MTIPTRAKIFIARQVRFVAVLLARLSGARTEDGAVRVRRRGLNWVLDLSEGIDLSIFLFGGFERSTHEAYEKLLKDGSIAIDVGANVGSHTLPLARCVGDLGRVVAVEPTLAVHRLRENVAANTELADRVSVVHAALAANEGDAVPERIYASWPITDPRDEAAETHPRHGGALVATEGAHSLTLDQLVREYEVPRIDLLKIDVDGYEMDVLRGAAGTLRTMHPVIVMELAPYTWIERGEPADAPLDFLRGLGYRFSDLSGRRFSSDGLVVPNVAAGQSINIIATAT